MLAISKNEKKSGAVLSEVSEPTVKPTDVLIKVKAASICGTDVHIYKWDPWAMKRVSPPVIFGHEFCGEVVEIGSLVKGFEKGDFVSVESHIPCQHCFQCQNDQMHICKNLKILGIDINGGFAEYVAIPEICVWKNPKEMPLEIASVQEPLGNAVYATLAEEVTGKSVAIFGCGPAGLFSVGVAAASGAHPVIFIMKHAFRKPIAEQMGATHTLESENDDLIDQVMQITHAEGVDVVLEMTGSPTAIRDAFRVVKKGGRISAFGIPSDPITLDLAQDVIFKGVRVLGINGRKMYQTWHQMRNLLMSGKLNPMPVITHRFALKEFEQGMQVMISPDRRCGKVVLFP